MNLKEEVSDESYRWLRLHLQRDRLYRHLSHGGHARYWRISRFIAWRVPERWLPELDGEEAE